MRILTFAVPVLCALAVSGCGSTWQGVQRDMLTMWQKTGDGEEVIVDRPSVSPDVNYSSRAGMVLKPPAPGVMAAPPAPPLATGTARVSPDTGMVWHDVTNYDLKGGSEKPPVRTNYNQSVEVFPIDESSDYFTPPAFQQGDAGTELAPVTAWPIEGAAPAAGVSGTSPSSWYGNMQQRIYFGHGSATVNAADRTRLNGWAGGITGDNVAITVVGHASKRVDGVTDPVTRKMINLKMAQKRANAVTAELKKAGVNPGWVQTVSKGEEEPAQVLDGKRQEDADRRAEIFVGQ